MTTLNGWKPSQKLARWIRAYGVRPLARDLQARLRQVERHLNEESVRQEIYDWLRAERAPNPSYAAALITLSQRAEQGRLSYEDIYGS